MSITILNTLNMKVAVYNEDTMKLIIPPRTNDAKIYTPHKCVESATFGELVATLKLAGVSPVFEVLPDDTTLDDYYNFNQDGTDAPKTYISYKI